MTMEWYAHTPSPIERDQLEQWGFSREHIVGLERVKACYWQEIRREADRERHRLEFIRWLYLQGRLQS